MSRSRVYPAPARRRGLLPTDPPRPFAVTADARAPTRALAGPLWRSRPHPVRHPCCPTLLPASPPAAARPLSPSAVPEPLTPPSASGSTNSCLPTPGPVVQNPLGPLPQGRPKPRPDRPVRDVLPPKRAGTPGPLVRWPRPPPSTGAPGARRGGGACGAPCCFRPRPGRCGGGGRDPRALGPRTDPKPRERRLGCVGTTFGDESEHTVSSSSSR